MTTAVVLTGGGSLGAAQVGMLQAIAKRGVAPDLLVGTFRGALNDAWVAGPVHSRSPVRPSPCLRPRMDRGRFGFFPELRTPPLPTTHVRAGTGHRALTRATSSTAACHPDACTGGPRGHPS